LARELKLACQQTGVAPLIWQRNFAVHPLQRLHSWRRAASLGSRLATSACCQTCQRMRS